LLDKDQRTGLLDKDQRTGLLGKDKRTGLLDKDKRTGLLDKDKRTGLLDKDKRTGLLDKDKRISCTHQPHLLQHVCPRLAAPLYPEPGHAALQAGQPPVVGRHDGSDVRLVTAASGTHLAAAAAAA
jgi:hypothetical protein